MLFVLYFIFKLSVYNGMNFKITEIFLIDFKEISFLWCPFLRIHYIYKDLKRQRERCECLCKLIDPVRTGLGTAEVLGLWPEACQLALVLNFSDCYYSGFLFLFLWTDEVLERKPGKQALRELGNSFLI